MNRRLKACLCLGVTLGAWMVLPVTAQMSHSNAYGECQLPDVRRAWNLQPPVQIANVDDLSDAGVSGTTARLYRVSMKPCKSDYCKPGSHAALIKIDIPAEGRYRVAVDQMVWIDVLDTLSTKEGVLCEHSGCQPIRKIVQFDLQKGLHWVALQSKAEIDVNVLLTWVKP